MIKLWCVWEAFEEAGMMDVFPILRSIYNLCRATIFLLSHIILAFAKLVSGSIPEVDAKPDLVISLMVKKQHIF